MIYNIFGSGIYISKYKEFHNRNIGLFSVNETRIAGYFIVMDIDLRMRKVLQATILSTELISIPTNTKFVKTVRYIRDNKS